MPLKTRHMQARHGQAQAVPQQKPLCEADTQPIWGATFTRVLSIAPGVLLAKAL
jgi:hypothetical protein